MFDNRKTYRRCHGKKGLTAFTITVKETNLNIQAQTNLTDTALRSILKYRQHIEAHIAQYPEFAQSLAPLKDPGPAPAIVNEMIHAGNIAGVGPMAGVAGAVAEFTGKDLLEFSPEVVVENGGDIFVKSDSEMVFTIYAGQSPLSMKTGILVAQRHTPFAMCTSSGTIGHSKSFGRADAACVLADSCALADAAATAIGNQVSSPKKIEAAIATGRTMEGVQGIAIIAGKQIGLWGDLKLVRIP
ncbi:MAG: UPF0280 family protein [Desulfobacter sp.]|nr:MAG: UPF0280 family protein [Desulfobacter sp.]